MSVKSIKKHPAAINLIWLFMILLATVVASYNGRMKQLVDASFESAKSSVNLAIGLIGVMALWLGLMKVAEAGGLMRLIARAIRPVMHRLFPDVPAEHPAMSAMIMNMAANALGLGNAATPMGIKAMMELDRLNPNKGEATNAMCLFLAINTSSVTILPLGVIGVRAAAGAAEPASILIPSLVATICSTAMAVVASKAFIRFSSHEAPIETVSKDPEDKGQDFATVYNGEKEVDEELYPPGWVGRWAVILIVLIFAGGAVFRLTAGTDWRDLGREIISYWLVPAIMCSLLLFGYLRGVKVYEAATAGAKEGFQVAVKIIPFLVMILVAIGMFRASGAFDLMVSAFQPLTSMIGMPADALPMAFMRPLSGSGAFGIMSEVVSRAPDSFSSFLVSTMQGSTETTFYVLAVYFGAVGVVRTRHAVAAALFADITGILMALVMCHIMF
ncbi:MAG: spore maturation protein [Deltaproteobacteria bacterium]|nr:spore maturation protein [Deltaproteobacteria bacterium]MDL1960889.1 spore maturation protein [Deltaproteobacteria bacterium]